MDASLPEFLLLFVIGLLVLGPERMAQVAKKIGHFVGYARRMSRNFQVQLEDELEMKQIRDSLPNRVDLKKELGLDKIEEDIRKIGDDLESNGGDKPIELAPEDKPKGLPAAPGQPEPDIPTGGSSTTPSDDTPAVAEPTDTARHANSSS